MEDKFKGKSEAITNVGDDWLTQERDKSLPTQPNSEVKPVVLGKWLSLWSMVRLDSTNILGFLAWTTVKPWLLLNAIILLEILRIRVTYLHLDPEVT